MKRRIAMLILTTAMLAIGTPVSAMTAKTWEIIADKDNTFKVVGQKKPVITVRPGEVVTLKIVGRKGTEWAKDGAIHSVTINALKEQGWDVRFKEGTSEYTLVAPAAPGEYEIECAVKCGPGHEDMKMKLVVKP